MRAGLLSDPTVVALLQHVFVPCLSSALNTPDLIGSAEDVALLGSYAASSGEPFRGGEREAFVLPDGRMLDVFMSLKGKGSANTHENPAARRLPAATAAFRRHAEQALLRLNGALPADWANWWDRSAPAVVAVTAKPPVWPSPPAGTTALRVFVRNGHPSYGDLHGIELLPLDGRALLAGGIAAVGDAADLAPELFRDLVRAMVPRGDVDTRLVDASIGGHVRCRATAAEGDVITGVVTGAFTMTPQDRAEVGRRANAAGLFEARGGLVGEFAWNRSTGRFLSLRAAAAPTEYQVVFPWSKPGAGEVLPYAAAIEVVAGSLPDDR